MITSQDYWELLRGFSPTVYDAFPDDSRVREEYRHRAYCVGELYYKIYHTIAGDLDRGSSLMDVGAYPGTFLRLCREVLFRDRYLRLAGMGIELAEDEANYRRKTTVCDRVEFIDSPLGFQDYFRSLGIDFFEMNLDYCYDKNGELPTSLVGSFDVVTCIEMIEHLHTPYRLIKVIRDLLKPGGVCVVETNNVANIVGILKLFLKGRSNLDFELVERFQRDGYTTKHPHVRFYSLTELEYLLRKAGLGILSSESFSWKIPERLLKSFSWQDKFRSMLFKCFPGRESHILVKARKST